MSAHPPFEPGTVKAIRAETARQVVGLSVIRGFARDTKPVSPGFILMMCGWNADMVRHMPHR